jgi:hypothetical protein
MHRSDDQLRLKALRYLIHGDPGRRDNTDEPLVLVDKLTTGSAWGKLSGAALDLMAGGWRQVPPELVGPLALDDYKSLRLQSVGRELTVALLQELRDDGKLGLISCKTLTEAERDQVLRELGDDELLGLLPMHEDTEGNLRSISDKTYLEDEFPSNDPLAKHAVIIRQRKDKQAEWRQTQLLRPWSPEQALRLALGLETPQDYGASIVKALQFFAKGKALSEDLRKVLRATKWLTMEVGTSVSPERVIYLPGLEKEVADIAAQFPGEVVDAGTLNQLFKQPETIALLDRYAFPYQPFTVLGDALAKRDAYLIGLKDVLTDEALNDWLSVWEGVQAPVMEAASIVRKMVEVSDGKYRKDVLRYLLPRLAIPIPPARYVAVLNYLALQHESPRAYRERYRTVHTWYLAEATRLHVFNQEVLPKLLLLNRRGQWKPATELCAGAENISQADSLHDDHWNLLKDHVQTGTGGVEQAASGTNETREDSAHTLVRFLKGWETACRPELLGAFVAILGDEPILRSAAEDWLSGRGRNVENIRDLFGWIPQPQRAARGWIAAETLSDVMVDQRVSIRLVPSTKGATIRVTNLVGGIFTAGLDERVENLIIGSLSSIAHSPVSVPLRQPRVAMVTLRAIDPRQHVESAEDILKRTVELIWGGVYLQNGGLDAVWSAVGPEDQLSIQVVQRTLKEHLLFYLNQLRIVHNSAVADLRSRWNNAKKREAQEAEAIELGKLKQRRPEVARDLQVISKELGVRLEGDPEVQGVFYQAVRQTIEQHFQYRSHSVPFELFQNADDATSQLAELGEHPSNPHFVILATPNRLTFIHWGRLVNRFKSGQFAQARFENDLHNMLVMHASDKAAGSESPAVTGKFGLGFKSVFLVTKHPKVLSGTIGFQVVGGVYPKLLDPDARQQLRSQVRDAGLDPHDATIIDLPLEVDASAVLERFHQLAPILHAFARSIRTSEVNSPPNRQFWQWLPTLLPEVPHMEVGEITLNGTVSRALLFRASDNAAILLALNGRGIDVLPPHVPTIWVTAPTSESARVGFALNAMFAVDPGRARLAERAPANDEVVQTMGRFIGNSLATLAWESHRNWEPLRQALGLDGDTSNYDFWASLWRLLGHHLWQLLQEHRDSRDVGIAHQVLWDTETGALPQVLHAQPVLPSELPGDYEVLCALSEVKHQVSGVLAERKVFEQVALWPSFRARHVPGSLVAGDRVGRPLRSLMPAGPPTSAISIIGSLQAEVRDLNVTPEQAERIGETISSDLLKAMEEGRQELKDERRELIPFLRSLKFRSQSGAYRLSTTLVIADWNLTPNRDEPLRAAFAPAERVLSDQYGRAGADFFRLCRQELSADREDLAAWVLEAATDAAKRAALKYLLAGDLSPGMDPGDIGPMLARRKAGTWLDSLLLESPLLADFNELQRLQIVAKLERGSALGALAHLFSPSFGEPQAHPLDPKTVLEEIAKRWERESPEYVQRYEELVYPDGRMPNLVTDRSRLSQDVTARREWMELFILGATHSLGYIDAKFMKSTLLQWRERGWLDHFATPPSRQGWLVGWSGLLEDYFKDSLEKPTAFYWLRLLPSIWQFSRWLDDYIDIFLSLEQRGRFALHTALTPRNDPSANGIDAPSLVPALSLGACFVVRELTRKGVLNGEDVHRYCYVPRRRIRRLLADRLGCPWLGDEYARTEHSRSIYAFIKEHLPANPTFTNSFDLALRAAIDDGWLDGIDPTWLGTDEEDEE